MARIGADSNKPGLNPTPNAAPAFIRVHQRNPRERLVGRLGAPKASADFAEASTFAEATADTDDGQAASATGLASPIFRPIDWVSAINTIKWLSQF
jgi:hypothetical protein